MQFPGHLENTPLTLLSSVEFHLKFHLNVEDFFQILWPSQNIRTLFNVCSAGGGVINITN